jgi:nucleotide-binding universal stress UspA family protein
MAESGAIVVGTDGSETAERAVDRAYKGSASQMAPSSGEDKTRAQECVDSAQQRLSQSGVDSETHVWAGSPAEGLVKVADEHNAQMIVVGNRGMTGMRRVLGSVPNDVSHQANCSVLIVPTDA